MTSVDAEIAEIAEQECARVLPIISLSSALPG
jgi:hypothetical protein